MDVARLIKLTGVVAAAAALCAGLATGLTVLNGVRLGQSDPLNQTELVELTATSRKSPRDADLRQRIRLLDLELRGAYFTVRERTRATGILAIGSLAVLAAALGMRRVLSNRIAPPSACPGPNPEFAGALRAQHILGWCALALLVGVALASWFTDSVLDRDLSASMIAPAGQGENSPAVEDASPPTDGAPPIQTP